MLSRWSSPLILRPSPGSTFQVSRSGPSVSARIEAVRATLPCLSTPILQPCSGFISPPNFALSATPFQCRAVRSHRRRHHRSAKVICTTPHGAGDIRAQFARGMMLLCTPVLRAVWRVQAASARASRMRTTTSTEVRGVRRRCVPVRVLLLRVPPTCARGCSAWRTRARARVRRFLSRPCFALCADVCSEPMLRAPAVAGRVCAAHQ